MTETEFGQLGAREVLFSIDPERPEDIHAFLKDQDVQTPEGQTFAHNLGFFGGVEHKDHKIERIIREAQKSKSHAPHVNAGYEAGKTLVIDPRKAY